MKTAVQWLLNEWQTLETTLPNSLIEEVLEMEKQQIMQSLNDGKAMAIGNLENKTLEQYYKEKFNNED